MNIVLGTNYYKESKRQSIARQSHIKLKNKFTNLKLVSVDFQDEKKNSIDTDIVYDYSLTRSSQNIFPEWKVKLPFVNDIFESLSKFDCDYFIYTNSDIIISDRLIKYIEKQKPDAMACSRLEINPIETLNDTIIPIRWEIAGFDTFVFNKRWFLQNKRLFEDFFIGRPAWDHHYAGLIKIFGGNWPIGNKNPAFCFHVNHGQDALKNDNPGYSFNLNQMNNSKYRIHSKIWDDYCHKILIPNRTPSYLFLNEIPNEEILEKNFFQEYIDSL